MYQHTLNICTIFPNTQYRFSRVNCSIISFFYLKQKVFFVALHSVFEERMLDVAVLLIGQFCKYHIFAEALEVKHAKIIKEARVGVQLLRALSVS